MKKSAGENIGPWKGLERPKDNNLRLLELAVHQIFDKFHDHYIIVEIKSDKCGVNMSTIHFPGKIS